MSHQNQIPWWHPRTSEFITTCSRRSRHGPWHEIDCSTVYWRRLWCQLEGGFDPSRNSWHSTKNYQSQFWIGFCRRTPQLSFIYQQFLRPRLLLTLLSIFWTPKTNDRSQNQQFFRHSEILISIGTKFSETENCQWHFPIC